MSPRQPSHRIAILAAGVVVTGTLRQRPATLLINQIQPQWLREGFTGAILLGKSVATCLIVAGLVLSALGSPGRTRANRGGIAVRFPAPTRTLSISRLRPQ